MYLICCEKNPGLKDVRYFENELSFHIVVTI